MKYPIGILINILIVVGTIYSLDKSDLVFPLNRIEIILLLFIALEAVSIHRILNDKIRR